MSFTFNALKEIAMPRNTVKCTSTCSAHAAAIAAKSEEPFSTCHGLGLILMGPRFHFRPTKPRWLPGAPLIQDHPLRPLTSSGCNHMGENWTFKINKKGGKHVFGLWKSKWKDANDLKRKKWHLYQPGKRPRCWFALKTNADARMPKGRLSNCCPNQWTSMTITGFTACICWDPQVFKPIFSKLMLVGDVDGSCGS